MSDQDDGKPKMSPESRVRMTALRDALANAIENDLPVISTSNLPSPTEEAGDD